MSSIIHIKGHTSGVAILTFAPLQNGKSVLEGTNLLPKEQIL